MHKKNKAQGSEQHQLEALEERILLSADPLLISFADSSEQTTETTIFQVAEQSTIATPDERKKEDPFQGLEAQPLNTLALSNNNLSVDGELIATDQDVFVIDQDQELSGNGSFQGHLINNGVMGPGNSPGIVELDSVTYNAGSELVIEIGGKESNQFDQVKVDNLAQLGGKLTIKVIDGFSLKDGDSFQIMTFGGVEGQFESADGLFGLEGGSGYFQIVQSENGLELVYRELGNGLAIDFASQNDADAFGEKLNSHYFNNTDPLEGQARIQFSEFIYFQGNLHVDYGVANDMTVATGFPISLDLPAELNGLDRTYLTLSMTNASGFIGLGGPDKVDLNYDGDFDDEGEVNSQAKGIVLQDVNLGMAYFNLPADFFDLSIDLPDLATLKDIPNDVLLSTLPSFYALKADIGSIEVVGFDDLFSLSAGHTTISINGAGSWLPASGVALDFATSFDGGLSVPVAGGADPIILDFSGAQQMSATLFDARMSLLDFVHVYGDLTLEKGLAANVNVATGLPSDVSELIGLIGADSAAAAFIEGLENPSTINDLEVAGLSIAGSGLKAFVGVSGGFDSEGNLTSGATGLALSGVDFAYVDFTPTNPALSELLNFQAISATATSVEAVGIDQLTVSATDIRININTGKSWPGGLGTAVIDFGSSFLAENADNDADGDGNIDPAGYEVKAGSQSIYIDYDGNERIAASLNQAELSVGGFVTASGDFSFQKGPTHTVNVKVPNGVNDDSYDVEVESLQIGGQNVTVFAGIGGIGFDSGNNINDRAIGILLSDVDFAYASFKPTGLFGSGLNASFQALSVLADSGQFVGLGDVAELSDVRVAFNSGKLFGGTTVTPYINFAGSGFDDPLGYAVQTSSDINDKIYLNFDSNQQLIAAHGSINLAGLVTVNGAFAFNKVKAVSVDVSSNIDEVKKALGVSGDFQLGGDIDVLTVGISDATVEVDLGVAGATLEGVTGALFLGTPTLAGLVPGSQQYVPKFVALKVNAQSVTSDSLAFNLSGSNIVFEANFTQFPGVDPTTQAILNAVAAPAIDFSSSFDEKQYDVAIGPTETIALAFAGQAFRLAIEQATVKIKNPLDGSAVVQISGGIAIERLSAQTVTLTDNTTLDEVDGITLVGKNLTASINLGELNIDLGAEAEVGLALMRANTSDFYFALTAEISDAFELDIPGVNFTPTGAEININTKLNRDFSNPNELIDPPAIDFANSYTGELARGIDLNGNGKLDKFGLILPTTDNDVVNSAVLLNFSDHLLVVRGQGTFRFDDFSQVYLEGTFESALVGTAQNIFFDGKLKVSYGAGELEFYSKGLMVSQVDSENPENSFLAIKLSTQGGFEIPGVIAFDGGFEFTANTTDREITFEVAEDFQPLLGYSTVTIGGISGFQLRSTEGSLTLVDTFSIDGGVLISAGTSSGLNVAVDGNIGLLGLGTMSAYGDIALSDSGIKTDLSLVGQAKILNLITIGGDFNLSLEMDGFKSVPSIELMVANPSIKFWSLFTLNPSTSVKLSFDDGIFQLKDLTVGVDLSLVKSDVTVDYIKSNGDLKFSFDVGGGFDQNLGIFAVGASADATLKVKHTNGEFDVDADMSVTASLKVDLLFTKFKKSGTISAGLDLSIDPSDGEMSIGVDLFGKLDISIPIGFKLPLPDAPPPNVAALSGSAVTVHVGDKSYLRNYDKEVVEETVRIRQDGSKLIVDVQGKITKLDVGSGDYTINLDGGNGLDKVIIDSSVRGKINITNTETVKYAGSGLATITGTSGNDTVSIFGNGTAIINTGGGNDNVSVDGSGRTTIDLGHGNDVISLMGVGTHTLTPGAGDDRTNIALADGSLHLVLEEGFGNDLLSGNGILSRLDMSQLTSDINLEYDYHNSIFLMNSDGGNLSIDTAYTPPYDTETDNEEDRWEVEFTSGESGNTPQISQIDFGSGNDTYVIVSAFDMTLTENGGDNAFYYVESAGGTANLSGSQFSLNGKTITYDQNIAQFVLGNIDYSLVKESGAFKGTVSYRLASGSETLTLRNSGGTYVLPDARVEIFSNSVHFSSNFSALSWAISSKVDAVFNANLTATDDDIAIDQTSADGAVTLSGNLTSSNGIIDIAAVGSIVQTAGTLTTSTSGRQIQLRSTQGSIEQRDGSRVIATNGVITVVANQWINIAHLQAGTGTISLDAENGGIYDAGDTDVDIQAETLVFKAAEGFGTNDNDMDTDIERVNGTTVTGAINIQEKDSLEVMPEGLSVLTSGNILLNNLQGNLTVNGRVSIQGSGNIRLKADNGNIETDADIQTGGANAITLQARNSITQHAYTTISTGEGGSVDALAEQGEIEQHDGALITTGSTGSIRLQAQGAIKVAGLHVERGDVSLVSVAGDIRDSGDQVIDVLADQLRISAGGGAGARDDALDISVDVLAARAGSGGIHLNEANTIHIDTLTDITVQRVQADGSLETVIDAGISDLATSDNGDISLTSQDGDILVFNGSEHEDNAGIVANGSGDISLIASSGNITITGNTEVISERGDITLQAELNVLQEAGAGIIVSDSANGKQVRIEAVTGSVRQQDTSFIETVDSNIRVRAGENIDVASIRTGDATVTMEAISGGIYDAGDSDLDVVAENLEFTANKAFGVNNNDIDTQIANVFGHLTSGTINIQEEDGLNIHESGLSIADDGDILVHSKSGDIAVTGDVSVENDGHIRIKADQGKTLIDANVTTGSDSSITIQSLQNIHQLANSTISTTAGGTIDLWSEGASILQQDSAIITTGETGNARLLAGDSIELAAVHVGTGSVSLITEAGSIVDSGDSHKDIVARQLRVDASVGMGAGNAIDTSVDIYAGRAGSGGLHIEEDSDITVTTLDDISIQRVKSDGSTETVTDAAISDLRTSNNGSVSLETIDGTITIYDGNVPDDGVGIYAHGSGNIHLDAYGAGQDVRIKEDTDIVSDQGNIHVLAEDAVLQEAGADIAVGTGGNIAVRALNGSIYMTDGTSASTKGAGNILYHAKVDVDLSRLIGEAHTTVIADTGQIRDNLEIGADRINYDEKIDPDSSRVVDSVHTTVIRNGAEYFGDFKIGLLFGETANISSSSLSMIANQGIGVLGVQDIDTDVEQIEMVNKSRNHVFVQEADSVNVFGQGLRNFNDNGDLMFSTIVDELYIDGKNIRERFPDYSTDGQKVDGYTIDGYTLQDFYLDEGIRIVNGKVHTGKEGYLYVRSSVGDWGPMNYDQLADELSRIRNPEEVIVAAQNVGNIAQFFASGQEDDSLPGGAFDDNQSSEQRLLEDNLFGALSSDLYSPKSEELKMLNLQSIADLLNSQELLLAQGSEDIAIEYEAEVVEIEPSDNTEESVVIENELSDTRQKGDPALGLNGNLQGSIDQQAGDSEVRSFMSIVKRLYGDQVLDEQTLYGIYIKMMTELSGNPVDYETFKMQLSSNSL